MIEGALPIRFANQDFFLLQEKAIWWSATKTLILSDLHFGKAAHFRKNGLPISGQAHQTDLETLDYLLNNVPCQRLLILGDLFHSDFNLESTLFFDWIKSNQIYTALVPGNHDIMHGQVYAKGGIVVLDNTHLESGICFVHKPEDAEPEVKYVMHGHLHPGLVLRGKGKQHAKLSAFFIFDNHQLALPAFGALTGIHPINKRLAQQVFAITPMGVKQLNKKTLT